MASNSPTNLSLCLILLITFTCCTQSEAAQLHEETKMTVYLQDRTRGPNTTVVPIAGIPGKAWTYFSFGTVYCTDDPLTEGLEESSAQIGRAQGIFVISSLDGSIAHVLLSLVGTNEEYNGSTIEIQGASPQLDMAREVAVVGGTGKFRYARGYVTFETVYLDLANSYSVIRCNITLAPKLLPHDRQRSEKVTFEKGRLLVSTGFRKVRFVYEPISPESPVGIIKMDVPTHPSFRFYRKSCRLICDSEQIGLQPRFIEFGGLLKRGEGVRHPPTSMKHGYRNLDAILSF